MDFLKIIKQQLNDPKRSRGRIEIPVCRQSLMELVHHFERLDSAARAQSDNHHDLHRQLHNTLEALYREGRDSDRLMMSIMDTLSPLIQERLKQGSIPQAVIDMKFRT